MKSIWLMITSCIALIIAVAILLPTSVTAGPYLEDEDSLQDEYSESALENLLQNNEQKRGCVRRGGNCDHRPNDCCYNSSCRCNLWGSNCRCQRMGLFQKWG